MAAAAVALRAARDIVAASRDDTPSPLPVLKRFASTLRRPLPRPHSRVPTRTVADQRWLDHNRVHFATTRHEPAGQEGSRATCAGRTGGSQLPLTSADFASTGSPTARMQAMEWLSDAISQLPSTRDTTPANTSASACSRSTPPPAGSRPPHVMGPATSALQKPGPRPKTNRLNSMSSKPAETVKSSDFECRTPAPSSCAEQGIEMTSRQDVPHESVHATAEEEHTSQLAVNNSRSSEEFRPIFRRTVEQSSSDLASQSDEPNGMMIDLQEQRKSKRTFPTLGFRLVWNDAPNSGSQDAKRTYGKYEKVKTLGKGSFGTAVLLRHRRTGHLVVSKQVRVQEMPRAELSKVQHKRNHSPTRQNLTLGLTLGRSLSL